MAQSNSITETAVLTVLNESLQIFQKSIELRLNVTASDRQVAQADESDQDSLKSLQLLHAQSSALLGALRMASKFQSLTNEPEVLDNPGINQETADLIKAMEKHFTLCVQPLLQPHKNSNVFEILDMVQYEQTQWIESYAEDEIIPFLRINISRQTSESTTHCRLSEFNKDRLFFRIGIKYSAMRAKCLAEFDIDSDLYSDFDKAFNSLLKNDNED